MGASADTSPAEHLAHPAPNSSSSIPFRPPPQRWFLTPAHPQDSANLASTAHLPIVLAELLVARGIRTAEDAARFLNPEIDQLSDPFLMLGMATAATRVELAISRKETVLLYGDYDVDGTTAVVLLKTAIEMLGGVVRFHVPHRIREGYGLQSSVLETAAADRKSVV